MELSYTAKWPGGIEVTVAVNDDGTAEDCIAFPAAGIGQGRRLEISGPRPLTEVEVRLAAMVRSSPAVAAP